MSRGTTIRCDHPGCRRAWPIGDACGYSSLGGPDLCNRHWKETHLASVGCDVCGAEGVPKQQCGACRRRCCVDCYGQWNALACRDCQRQAREDWP